MMLTIGIICCPLPITIIISSTIIVGVASMEPTQRERQSLQEMMKTGLPRTA